MGGAWKENEEEVAPGRAAPEAGCMGGAWKLNEEGAAPGRAAPNRPAPGKEPRTEVKADRSCAGLGMEGAAPALAPYCC